MSVDLTGSLFVGDLVGLLLKLIIDVLVPMTAIEAFDGFQEIFVLAPKQLSSKMLSPFVLNALFNQCFNLFRECLNSGITEIVFTKLITLVRKSSGRCRKLNSDLVCE